MPDLSNLSDGTLALIALVMVLTIALKVVDKYLPSQKDETAVSVRQILANMNGLLQVLDRVTENNRNISETLAVVGKLQSDMHNMQGTISENLAKSSEKLALIHQHQGSLPALVAEKVRKP